MDIQYQKMTNLSELEEANKLIEEVWGKGTGVSIYLLVAQVHAGGLVIGAYLKEKLIGVSYGFPGIDDIGPFFYSHLLAINPEYQGHKIGVNLKQHQREVVEKAGFNRMKWTFDPLESLNAYVNFKKCHVVSREYHKNFYGELKDNLNAGTTSDRLVVVAELPQPSRTNSYKLLEEIPNGVHFEIDYGTEKPLYKNWLPLEDSFVKIAIPSNIQAMKEQSLDTVNDWRIGTREALQHYFSQGYSIINFDYKKNRPVQFYILHRAGKE